MAYADIEEETPDIMKIKLGNLPAGEKVTIKLAYLQILEISQNKFWKFELPSTLTPRFDNKIKKAPKYIHPAIVHPCWVKKVNGKKCLCRCRRRHLVGFYPLPMPIPVEDQIEIENPANLNIQ